MRVHLAYLTVIAILLWVALVLHTQVQELRQGNTMYVANLGELQQSLQQAVQRAAEQVPDRRDYAAHCNRLLSEGRIVLQHGGRSVGKVEFSTLERPDYASGRRQVPMISLSYAEAVERHGHRCDGVSFELEADSIRECTFARTVAP